MKDTKDNDQYPRISETIGIALSILYLLVLMAVDDLPLILLTLLLLSAYLFFMTIAEKKFNAGEYSIQKVRLVNIGGFFLFFFLASTVCVVRLDGLIP